jgi:hypothetical protein
MDSRRLNSLMRVPDGIQQMVRDSSEKHHSPILVLKAEQSSPHQEFPTKYFSSLIHIQLQSQCEKDIYPNRNFRGFGEKYQLE